MYGLSGSGPGLVLYRALRMLDHAHAAAEGQAPPQERSGVVHEGESSAAPVSLTGTATTTGGHRIRNGTGPRVGMVLSCEGWGRRSATLP